MSTLITNVGAGVNKFYDKRFLEMLVEQLRFIPYAQKRPLPEGNGVTIDFFRWLTLAKANPKTAANSGGRLLTEGVNPNAIAFEGQKLTATLAEYGSFAQPSSLLKQSHIDVNVTGSIDIFAEDAAVALDTLAKMAVVADGCYPITAHLDSATTYSGVLGTVTSTTVLAGGASLESNSAYGGTDDDMNQSVIVMTSGPAKGMSRMITDYDADGGSTGTAASGKMTVSPAFDMLPELGDSFTVTSPNDLLSGDNLEYASVKKARTLLKKFHARPFGNRFFIGIVDPDQASALMDDTQWKNIHTYKDQTMGLFDGEIGRFAGIRFIEESDNAFKFPFAATLAQDNNDNGPGVSGDNWTTNTGVGYATVVPIFGREAFGATTFARKSGQARRPSIIVKTPGPHSTNDALDRFSTVGWKIEAVYKGLQALHMINVWCQS